MDPGDLRLPAILDPILTYLADTLPPPLYNFILNFLSHCLALFSTLLSLILALLSRSPAEWNAQTILPPLIGLLAAYLALASIYRTTTWMIRTSFWLAKWGIILGAIVAGMGWYMGATQTGGMVTSSLVSHVGNLLMDAINGHDRNAVGGKRESSRSRSKSTKGPKAWESFDRHREWQYNEDHGEAEQGSDLERLFDNLMGMAGQMLREETWWPGHRTAEDGTGGRATNERDRTQGKTNSKSRSR
ncbi:hypothetical protein D9756_007416 [Leucocoprinus leucothites]|uniref:Uncharacterized protein n=1 Tax=Leucocoprinus leucothites TaxID=201217 RepID=A0A8H5D140_9AGAR|nr:hypothetical protein D9756_007416 [Leucoagaricus leucothites]